MQKMVSADMSKASQGSAKVGKKEESSIALLGKGRQRSWRGLGFLSLVLF